MLDDLIKDFKKLIFDNASRFIKPEVAHKEAKPLNKIHLLESKDLKFTPPFKGSFYNIGNYSPGVATDKNHPRGHNGVDLYVSKDPGSPIYSIANGIVSQVADTPKGGINVTIKHPQGYSSYYAHLAKATVKQGQTVTNDTMIGTCGSTGNAMGGTAHLHLEVSHQGSKINPGTLFAVPKYSLDGLKKKNRLL